LIGLCETTTEFDEISTETEQDAFLLGAFHAFPMSGESAREKERKISLGKLFSHHFQ
jgi:hypothetical protein